MRQGPHQKRGRGRGGNNNNRRPNAPNRNQTFDSNGPDVRIRGNAHQVYEKYLTLARDASTAGDRVHAESLFQHADHYFRIYSAYNEENEARRNAQPQENGQNQDQQSRGGEESESGYYGPSDGYSAQPSASQTTPSDDDAPSRKTRSERRQDAESAEQTVEPQPQQDRPPRQPRRRRNGAAPQADSAVAATPAEDNDAALRAMLGASDAGAPKIDAVEEIAPSEEPEAKPVRRRGRPRKVVEPTAPALPLAGED